MSLIQVSILIIEIIIQLLMKSRKSSNIDVPSDRIFIGVAGGSAAGKTTLCETINKMMAFDRNFKVQTISLDSFYKSIDKTQIDVAEYNFDHPLALDFDLAYQVLHKLKYSNEDIHVPIYSFVQHQRLDKSELVHPANIILFEGLMAFHDERIRNMMTYKIFINCDDDIRLCRRIKRDTTERGRTIQSVLLQYNKFVKNAFRDFIYPTIGYADLVIPGQRNNRISVDFIVEHIKNVARKKNIFKTAQQTKVFLFGENQYYDINAKKNYKDSIQLHQQSFLVFPTSDQHRRELEFFLNSLMSQAFTEEYFDQVYIYQFMKTIRSLLLQLFELKGYIDKKDKKKNRINDMELISVYQIREKLKMNSKKPIKILFLPIIFQREEQFLNYIKPLLKQTETVIIINIFCDMLYPTKIYETDIDGLVFINLFLVANKKRLLEILCANNINISKKHQQSKYPKHWFLHNRDLIERGLQFVANEFKIKYKPIDWEFQANLLEELTLRERQKDKLALFTYAYSELQNADKLKWEDESKVRKIEQVLVLPQEHPNLCGYHALHNIKEYPNEQNLRSKQVFLQNYMQFTHSLEKKHQSLKHLKNQLFEPLQRTQVPLIINAQQLFNEKEVAPLFISQNYIVNDKLSLKDLTKSLMKLKNLQISALYLLMGVHCHYFVLKLNGLQKDSEHKIQFMDSINTPISQIMNGDCSIPNKSQEDIKKIANMKTAIETVLELYYTQTDVQTMLVRLRVKDIVGSYNKYKKEGKLVNWISQEYTPQVLHNDLFQQMRQVSEQELGDDCLKVLKDWFNEDFVKEKVCHIENEHHPLKKFRQQTQ